MRNILFIILTHFLGGALCAQVAKLTKLATHQGNYYMNNRILCNMRSDSIDVASSKINSIIFRSDLADTVYRYSRAFLTNSKFRNSSLSSSASKTDRTLALGESSEPGLFNFTIETVKNTTERNHRPEHFYAWYELFVHPPGDDSTIHDTLAEHKIANLDPELSVLIDSLYERSNLDTLNSRLDSVVKVGWAIQTDPRRVDSSKSNMVDSLRLLSVKTAVIFSISGSTDSSLGSITIVSDPLYAKKASKDSIVDLFLQVIDTLLLDSSIKSIDTTSLSKGGKRAMREKLRLLLKNKNFKFINSESFVQELFRMRAGIDIDFTTDKYFLFRRAGQFKQLVFLMKIRSFPVQPPETDSNK